MQDEISFKAGMKNVVEWVEAHCEYHQEARIDIDWDEWQAFTKGIEHCKELNLTE